MPQVFQPMNPEQFLALCQPIGMNQIFDGLSMFVVVLDGSGNVVFWNRSIEAATGIVRKDVIGCDGTRFVSGAGDGELRTAQGERRTVSWQCLVAEVSGERLMYAMGTDVTGERAALQKTLQAERAAAASRLSAGIAHELRNPLNSAVLQLDVLENRIEQGRTEPASLATVLSTVRDELRRAGDAAGALFGLVPARQLTLRTVELNALLEGVVASKAAEIQAANTTLDVELDDAVGTVELDGDRIRRAVANLLDNALEAAPQNGRITLRSSSAEDAVVVEIEDDGPGFAETAPVFDAFFTTKSGKPGLGLAVARRAALDHGGTLEALSRHGRTCFRLSLPRAGRK